jgi:hypothetical protein
MVVECPEWALPIAFDQEHCIAARADARNSLKAGRFVVLPCVLTDRDGAL